MGLKNKPSKEEPECVAFGCHHRDITKLYHCEKKDKRCAERNCEKE